MKSRLLKSFRFEIILCSLFSLALTLVTESAFIYILIMTKTAFSGIRRNTISNPIGDLDQVALYGSIQPAAPHYYGWLLILFFAVLLGVFLFIIYFLLLTDRYTRYLKRILYGVSEMSIGNLGTRIEIQGEDEFAQIAENLNAMAEKVQEIMDQEREDEKEKNQLVTSVAHDLRTPLTSIIGYLDLVLNREDMESEVQRKYIGIAYERSKRLEQLIEDLFSYTKFSYGQVTMEWQEVDLIQLLGQILEESYPSMEENSLECNLHTKDKKLIIEADGNLLSRVFANLISNAVKYGKDGKCIEIKIEKDRDQAIVIVKNYGKIIPKESMPYIFNRFYRVEESRSDDTGGNGMGLAIVSGIMELHHGSVTAKSDLKGTEFEVRIPFRQK